MRFLLLLIFALSLSTPAIAASAVQIRVNGMVCDFCAQSVWKVFDEYEAVENTTIDLDAGTVTVLLKDGQTLSDKDLHKAITHSGYELVSIDKIEKNSIE